MHVIYNIKDDHFFYICFTILIIKRYRLRHNSNVTYVLCEIVGAVRRLAHGNRIAGLTGIR